MGKEEKPPNYTITRRDALRLAAAAPLGVAISGSGVFGAVSTAAADSNMSVPLGPFTSVAAAARHAGTVYLAHYDPEVKRVSVEARKLDADSGQLSDAVGLTTVSATSPFVALTHFGSGALAVVTTEDEVFDIQKADDSPPPPLLEWEQAYEDERRGDYAAPEPADIQFVRRNLSILVIDTESGAVEQSTSISSGEGHLRPIQVTALANGSRFRVLAGESTSEEIAELNSFVLFEFDQETGSNGSRQVIATDVGDHHRRGVAAVEFGGGRSSILLGEGDNPARAFDIGDRRVRPLNRAESGALAVIDRHDQVPISGDPRAVVTDVGGAYIRETI